jgi:hypothetical protein
MVKLPRVVEAPTTVSQSAKASPLGNEVSMRLGRSASPMVSVSMGSVESVLIDSRRGSGRSCSRRLRRGVFHVRRRAGA